jgi:hypothetical protein
MPQRRSSRTGSSSSAPVSSAAPVPPVAPPTAWLNALKLQQLRAISWHYTALAVGKPSLLARRIDPRPLSKVAAYAHILTNIKDVALPSAEALRAMVTTFKNLSDQDVISALETKATRGRGSRPSPLAALSDEPVDAPASESDPPPPPPPGSNKRKRKRPPTPSLPHDSEDDSSHSVDSRGSRTSIDHGSEPDSHSRSVPTLKTRIRIIHMQCPTAGCTRIARSDRMPDFCDKCGKAWGRSATTTTTAAPQRWDQLDRFVYTPLATLTAAPFRTTQLAHLPEAMIKKAREGQQHYTIADLLCPLAHDGSFSSALADEHTFVLAMDHSGTLTTRSGAPASDARSLNARKRTISSFEHITEVFVFTLIPIIYEGRPDIAQQLYRLHSAALDISRSHDWKIALQYINHVRYNYWMDPGVRLKHILNIDTTFDLGAFSAPTLLIAQAATPHNRAQHSGGTSQATARAPYCGDWNRNTCTRGASCKFPHVCSACGGAHQRINCKRNSAQQGPLRTTTPQQPARSATPAASD